MQPLSARIFSFQVAGQSNVKFRWKYTGSYGWYWAVDDIRVTGYRSQSMDKRISSAKLERYFQLEQ